MRRLRVGFCAASIASLVLACGWSPSKPFEREAPEVREAIQELDAGKAKNASARLEEYLATGACDKGRIGTPPRVRERPSGSFDLGLAFFGVAETYGHRFGDEESDAGLLPPSGIAKRVDPNLGAMRAETVGCALAIVRAVAEDRGLPAELRARARYVEGNLLFLNGNYEDAVKAYDHALGIAPGMHASGPSGASDSGKPYEPDAVGRDAAFNRAIALRRIEDKKKDAGSDAGSDGGNDGGGSDGGDGGGGDGGNDGSGGDGGPGEQDPSGDKQPEPKDRDAGPPPPTSQDERILDQLENAKTVQREAAKARGTKRVVRGLADK